MSLNLCKRLTEFNINEVEFNQSIKNKIIKGDHSIFTGVSLKYDTISLNNICLYFSIYQPNILTYDSCDLEHGKYKCIFNEVKNYNTIKILRKLEDKILNKYCILNNKYDYEKVFMLKNYTNNSSCWFKFYKNENLNNNIINNFSYKKLQSYNNDSYYFAIKISGVWENNGRIGVSYKICLI